MAGPGDYRKCREVPGMLSLLVLRHLAVKQLLVFSIRLDNLNITLLNIPTPDQYRCGDSLSLHYLRALISRRKAKLVMLLLSWVFSTLAGVGEEGQKRAITKK